MSVKKIKLIEPLVGKEELECISEVLSSGWLTEGQKTKEFEERVKNFVDAKYAVATTSCTTAFELALRALDVGPRDEVIVPDFTHPSTGNIVKWVGAKPILVDVDLFSYNVDPKEVEKAITKNTRCIMPVSWGGNPLNMQPLNEMKEKHNLSIIEDAACSLGAQYNGKKTGTMADITCFSFHPRKIITTGEGGMAVTDNPVYAEKLQTLKRFGMTSMNGETKFAQFGTNYKLSDILGAVGVKQMEKITRIINKRIELANYYNDLLAEVDSIRAPEKRENSKHVYQTYAAYIEKEGTRDKLIADLRKENIETQIGTYALHLQPSYERVKKIGKLERAEKLYRNLLALPMCHLMTKKDQEYVVSEIKNLIEKY
ncbi:MAG: DegT/DnrJ/EryC1/StrS family aminotransferase [Candidatus Bathyarchaeota archaeon]|nr:DegT/DnrJ/EryC1/StrS family aminotransferase [Candidatus Bathyarchaeota archaeon]MDH5745864.1 DegT/DnrJ/EryC1/StrS family aminotransferase [Candidatus Bathyarchaeota archaeon]